MGEQSIRTRSGLIDLPVRRSPAVRHAPLLVFSLVFAAALFGIATRSVGFLATFWPANALLLGLFIRAPRFATIPAWIAAFAAFVTADLLTGGDLRITLWLSTANLAGVMGGYLVFRGLRRPERLLARPHSFLLLFAVCLVAATASAVTTLPVVEEVLDRPRAAGLAFWLSSELASYMVVVPVLLTMPTPPTLAGWYRNRARLARAFANAPGLALPLVALVASGALGIIIGGPGAIAFTVPALTWCAVRYGVFATSVLTLAVGVADMFAVSTGVLDNIVEGSFYNAILSIRLGIALFALGPLTVASVLANQQDLLQRLDRAASRDYLTGTLSRSAFAERGEATLRRLERDHRPAALLMVDIDRFKRINDGFGHAVGDHFLQRVAGLATESLPLVALVSRIGGDEFAILLPGASRREAIAAAEAVCDLIAREAALARERNEVGATASVGVAQGMVTGDVTLEQLMSTADMALYRAKAGGRNRVELAEDR